MTSPNDPNQADAVEPPPRGFGRRLLLFLGPPAVVFFAWWLTHLFYGAAVARECLLTAGAFLTIVGPTIILGRAVGGDYVFQELNTWHLVMVAAFMTVVTAFFWTYNLDLFERLPRLGPVLQRARARMAANLAEHRWIRRLAVVGVGLFVLMPMPGSGTVGGSLVGRIVGLTRRASFVAVTVGGVLVTLIYGYFSNELTRLSESYQLSTPVKIGLGLAFVASMWLIGKLIVRLGRSPAAAPAGAPAEVHEDSKSGD